MPPTLFEHKGRDVAGNVSELAPNRRRYCTAPPGNFLATETSRLYTRWMLPWSEIIDPMAAQNGFAGVVSVDRGGEVEFARAYGLAHV
jgi:hypothetical protein